MRPNPVIDVHAHVVPARWGDWSARHIVGPWPTIAHHDDGNASLVVGGRAIRAFTAGAFDAAARLEDMDRRGVDVHAISPPPPMFCYWAEAKAAQAWACMQNENIAGLCAAHPGRFVGLVTLPMQARGLAIEELAWVRERAGLHAVEIRLGTIVNGVRIGGGSGRLRIPLKQGPNEIAIGGRGTPYVFNLVLNAVAL